MLHFFLWKDFCQDEIKQYFSNQRQFGPCSDNPDLQMFKYNSKAIHVSCTSGNRIGRYDKLKNRVNIDNTPMSKQKTDKLILLM